MKPYLLLSAALVVAGCSNAPVGQPYFIPNELKEISFQGAHADRHCSKGCHYRFVPDTWYLLFCAPNGAGCFWRKIFHAPWSWQMVGTKVRVYWQMHERSGSELVRITGADGRELEL